MGDGDLISNVQTLPAAARGQKHKSSSSQQHKRKIADSCIVTLTTQPPRAQALTGIKNAKPREAPMQPSATSAHSKTKALLSVASLTAAMTLSTPASAITPFSLNNLSIGLRGGIATNNVNYESLASKVNQRGGHNISLSGDRRDQSGSLFASYWFQPGAAIEISALYLGQFNTKASGTSSNLARLPGDYAQSAPNTGGGGVSATLRYKLPINRYINFSPRFGGYYWRNSNSLHTSNGSNSASNSGFGGTFGMGLDVPIYKRLSVGIGWDLFIPSSTVTQSQAGIGLEIKF